MRIIIILLSAHILYLLRQRREATAGVLRPGNVLFFLSSYVSVPLVAHSDWSSPHADRAAVGGRRPTTRVVVTAFNSPTYHMFDDS